MSETCLPCPPTKLDNNDPYVFSFYEDIVQVNRHFFRPPLRSSLCVYVCLLALTLNDEEESKNLFLALICNLRGKNVYHCLIHA
jgi:hypothetical protein